MKKILITCIIIVLILLLLILSLNHNKGGSKKMYNRRKIEDIKESYYNKAKEEGKLEELYYDTYESKTYNEKKKKIKKRAIIYTPYGYDKEKKYNILYLMHGGWSNETTSLGTPDKPNEFKNVIDNAIEDGKIKPIIIVCPTYNNESSEDSSDYNLAYNTLTVNYHNELENDLIPAVESKYKTYAKNTTDEDIIKSRNHRAFGGFSMGSVTTWYTFVNSLDKFKYFITASGAIDPRIIDESVKKQNYTNKDYHIESFTGTEDFAGEGFTELINDLKSSASGNFNDSNLNFRIKNGYSHNNQAFMTYMYNGIRSIWNEDKKYTLKSTVGEVRKDNDFKSFGNLIFPVDKDIKDSEKLENVGNYLTWYNNINPNKTVEIINYMKNEREKGNKIFYDIYTDEEKRKEPEKKNTGLFFFRGEPNSKFAVVNAGGGFVYVAALHDSFPQALELSKKGYNAFALIYRPDSEKASEDLAHAIAFINEHKDELKVDTKNYSLWGGSAGARMAAWVGTYGTDYFGEKKYRKPSAVIMEYTGLSEVTGNEPPTFNVVGTNDFIAPYKVMQERINKIKKNGQNAEIEIFDGLGHGFGLGEGTKAEGWINDAIRFWDKNSI